MSSDIVQRIAREIGVTERTVLRVLAERRPYSRPTLRARAERIRELGRVYGYRPNAAARAVSTGRFQQVTLILSAEGEGRSELPRALLRGIHDALESHHMRLGIAFLPDARLTDPTFVPKFVEEWTSDGLLVNYNKLLPPGLEVIIARAGVPAIWINHKRPADACYPDDLNAGREGVRRLLALGHRRIAYCSFSYRLDALHYSEIDRRQGYLEAMKEAGHPPCVVDPYTHPVSNFEDRVRLWVEMLSRRDRPTAVLVYGNTSAMSVVRATDRIGMEVPVDLSLICFGTEPVFAGREVDTLLVPDAEVGRHAVEMLRKKIHEPNGACPSRAIPFGFRFAGSSAPAPVTLRTRRRSRHPKPPDLLGSMPPFARGDLPVRHGSNGVTEKKRKKP